MSYYILILFFPAGSWVQTRIEIDLKLFYNNACLIINKTDDDFFLLQNVNNMLNVYSIAADMVFKRSRIFFLCVCLYVVLLIEIPVASSVTGIYTRKLFDYLTQFLC